MSEAQLDAVASAVATVGVNVPDGLGERVSEATMDGDLRVEPDAAAERVLEGDTAADFVVNAERDSVPDALGDVDSAAERELVVVDIGVVDADRHVLAKADADAHLVDDHDPELDPVVEELADADADADGERDTVALRDGSALAETVALSSGEPETERVMVRGADADLDHCGVRDFELMTVLDGATDRVALVFAVKLGVCVKDAWPLCVDASVAAGDAVAAKPEDENVPVGSGDVEKVDVAATVVESDGPADADAGSDTANEASGSAVRMGV